MVNRRGAIFNRSLFHYPEIADVELAVSKLMAVGHARTLGEADYPAFVVCLPKDVLLTGAQAAGREDVRKSWSKPKFINYHLEQIPFSVAAQHCGARKFIALDGTRPIKFLLYLYFGRTEIDLKNFALRDLGILRTNQETSFSARFTDGDEAEASFHYSQFSIVSRSDRTSSIGKPPSISFRGEECFRRFVRIVSGFPQFALGFVPELVIPAFGLPPKLPKLMRSYPGLIFGRLEHFSLAAANGCAATRALRRMATLGTVPLRNSISALRAAMSYLRSSVRRTSCPRKR